MLTEDSVRDRPVVLSIEGVTKDFPGVRALDDVSMRLRSGEIVALLGQNGCGKSTLVKVLAGVYSADAGKVRTYLNRSEVHGHAMLHFIHQDLGLIESLSTVENLAIGRRMRLGGLGPLRRHSEVAAARAAIRQFGVDFDVRQPVSRLTPAQRTIVAIARAMDGWTTQENVLVLDEPTAALHREEASTLFAAVRQAAARGTGVIFISHRLEEVTQLAERVVVLRDGRMVADVAAAGLTAGTLAEMITGRRAATTSSGLVARAEGEAVPVLKVRGLAGHTVRHLDFDLRPGEILGIAGNLGSGREHVAGLVYGSLHRDAGTVEIDGVQLRGSSPHEARARGIALIPADRRAHGAVMSLSVRENLTLPALRPLSRGRIHLRRRTERDETQLWLDRVGMRPSMPDRAIGLFSGGNQQKGVIARWLRTEPKVLLVEEPTQGVDVGASASVRGLIIEAAQRGTAVLLSSSDNVDLTSMCSRVLVLRDGELGAELYGEAVDDHRLTQECLGVTDEQHLYTERLAMEADSV